LRIASGGWRRGILGGDPRGLYPGRLSGKARRGEAGGTNMAAPFRSVRPTVRGRPVSGPNDQARWMGHDPRRSAKSMGIHHNLFCPRPSWQAGRQAAERESGCAEQGLVMTGVLERRGRDAPLTIGKARRAAAVQFDAVRRRNPGHRGRIKKWKRQMGLFWAQTSPIITKKGAGTPTS